MDNHATYAQRQFYFCLPNLYMFYLLLLSYCISRSFSEMLEMSDNKGHPFLVPDLIRKASSFSLY